MTDHRRGEPTIPPAPDMDCGYPGSLPAVFLRPCLLLLLKEQPGHGYDLVDRLRPLGMDAEPAALYRMLRTLEEHRTVHSDWEFSNVGPARRVYQLTPQGDEALARGAAVLEHTMRLIDRYLGRYAQATEGHRCSEVEGRFMNTMHSPSMLHTDA